MSTDHPSSAQINLAWQFKKLVISRFVSRNSLVFLLQYIGLMLGTLILHPAPVELSVGTACAFVFMTGTSVLPGIWLGTFFAYSVSNSGMLLALICATLYTAQAFLLFWFCCHYISPSLVFIRRKLFIKFVLCCGVVTASVSYLLAVFSHVHWLQSWLANFNGILVIACAIATWDMYFPQINALQKLNKVKLVLSYGLLLLLIVGIVMSHIPMLFAWMTFPLILFIAACYGWCGSVAAIFLLGFCLSVAPVSCSPYLQLFLLIESIVIHTLSCQHAFSWQPGFL